MSWLWKNVKGNKITTELSREETVVFITQYLPPGFLSRNPVAAAETQRCSWDWNKRSSHSTWMPAVGRPSQEESHAHWLLTGSHLQGGPCLLSAAGASQDSCVAQLAVCDFSCVAFHTEMCVFCSALPIGTWSDAVFLPNKLWGFFFLWGS